MNTSNVHRHSTDTVHMYRCASHYIGGQVLTKDSRTHATMRSGSVTRSQHVRCTRTRMKTRKQLEICVERSMKAITPASAAIASETLNKNIDRHGTVLRDHDRQHTSAHGRKYINDNNNRRTGNGSLENLHSRNHYGTHPKTSPLNRK